MNLDMNMEQKLLKDSARDFLKKECPRDLLREVRDAEAEYPKKLWKKMAKLGWMGVGIPEAYGGMDGDFIDQTILIEAMAEACLPAPFFNTVIVGAAALQLSDAEDLKKALLPKIADGELVCALALIEPGNSHGFANIQMPAVKAGEDYVLTGTKLFVEYARSADYLLTVARSEDDGLGVFMVQADADNIHMQPLDTLDYSRQCAVTFDRVTVPGSCLLAAGTEAEQLLEDLEVRVSVAKCAEMLGNMQPAFEMSVDYAKNREQFGVPIGFFQAVQHHCANMAVDVDSSRYITSLAAWKIAQGQPAAMEASMAKSYISDAANRVVKLGHQVHGAISYCDEHDMHLFLRKSRAASQAFGDREYHLEKVAKGLGL